MQENSPILLNNVWSWDIEVVRNCFTLTAVNMADESLVKQFVIWENINQAKECVDFILSCKGLIGYNSLDFDYPIVHMCLLIKPIAASKLSGRALASSIYGFTQDHMRKMEMRQAVRVKPLVKQRDTYKIWHFDNDAKRTSLKWVECHIRWHNVEESPFEHHHLIKNTDELNKLLSYNLNDCLANRKFYLDKTLPKVKMRRILGQKFNLKIDNANDAKIGEEIILSAIAKKKGVERWDLRDLRTQRQYVDLSEVILPHIKFESKQFKSILEAFQSMRITNTRKEKDINVAFDGMMYEFGFGGIHAARQGLFYNINSCDVSSYYPNLGISFNFYPEHLGKEFAQVYLQIYNERKKYPKGTSENEALKLALNAVFGKSNSTWSSLYDPKMTMQITINGQLLLAMLCEKLTLSGAARVIMANTDGIEVEIFNHELYQKICKEWEETNRLTLEHSQYKVIGIRDVNNYIAVRTDGKTKEKGAYEVDKEIHKDPSMRVVPLAVREYFQKGTKISDFIKNHTDLWDFFMYVRAKTGEFKLLHLVPDTGEIGRVSMPKTIRYYISKEGHVLMKKTEKKFERVHAGVYIMPCNNTNNISFEVMDSLLDRTFYIKEAAKLIDVFYKKPEGLFI
jgi:hypothetical protein